MYGDRTYLGILFVFCAADVALAALVISTLSGCGTARPDSEVRQEQARDPYHWVAVDLPDGWSVQEVSEDGRNVALVNEWVEADASLEFDDVAGFVWSLSYSYEDPAGNRFLHTCVRFNAEEDEACRISVPERYLVRQLSRRSLSLNWPVCESDVSDFHHALYFSNLTCERNFGT